MHHKTKFTPLATRTLRCTIAPLLFACAAAGLHAADSWARITSEDGKVSALVPGEVEESTQVTRTLAGKITTRVLAYETGDVLFDLAGTGLPAVALKFAGEKGVIDSAKGKVLSQAMGKEKSFEDMTVSGVGCKLLRYDMVHHSDPAHRGFHGLALFFVHNGRLYVANGIVMKDAGMADIEKFADSIQIKP